MVKGTVRIGTAAALGLALLAGGARASSHREAPAISNDPAADSTGLWAWVTPGSHDRLHVVVTYIPLEEPSSGPGFHAFSDSVLYEVHVTRGTASLADAVTYQFRFTTAQVPRVDPADLSAPPGGGKELFAQLAGSLAQTYTVTKVENGTATELGAGTVAPPNAGPVTDAVTYGAGYDDAFAASFIQDLGADGRFWAGPRDDGSYLDLGGVFDLANLRPAGTAQDGLAGFNCHAIALELPTSQLTGTGQPPTSGPSNEQLLGLWASASRRKVRVLRADGTEEGMGPWMQVSRVGLPLVNTAIIGLQDRDRFNRTTPATDMASFGAYFLNPVLVRDAEAVGMYAALGLDPTPFRSDRQDLIDAINLADFPTPGAHQIDLAVTGDVLRVDLGVDSAFPNGRPIPGGAAPDQEPTDVTDALLGLILTGVPGNISDGVNRNDRPYLGELPFLAPPWRGWDQGHGRPAP